MGNQTSGVDCLLSASTSEVLSLPSLLLRTLDLGQRCFLTLKYLKQDMLGVQSPGATCPTDLCDEAKLPT